MTSNEEMIAEQDQNARLIVAEALAAGGGEPRVGRFERIMAGVAVEALREAGLLAAVSDTTPSEHEHTWDPETTPPRRTCGCDERPAPSEGERETLRMIVAKGSYGRSADDLPYADVANRIFARGFRLTPPAPVDSEKLAEVEAELAEWIEGKRSWCDQHHGKPDEIELTARADEATIRLLLTKRDALAVSPAPARDEGRRWYAACWRDDNGTLSALESETVAREHAEADVRRWRDHEEGEPNGQPDRVVLATKIRHPWEPLPVTEEEN